ncbi:MAG: hypothetical protein KU29_03745 [Sulfurovum sp. FS06-10]|jgi:hypothetical protein|nr:MAG: hypothetical protein KU29_03745 [Sulfurovum sp. FS06-10]
MKKLFFSLLLLLGVFGTLNAKTITADYKVDFGIIGEIGVAKAKLTQDGKNYVIDVELESTGIAKTLSGNRKEHHISKGHFENGVMVADLYQIIKSHGRITINKVYRINHKKKIVTKKYKEWKKDKLVSEENSTMDYYSKNDLLTLYFNLNEIIKDKTKSKKYILLAVGAEKQHGEVEIVIPNQNELKEFKEMLGENKDVWYARAIIHQSIFSSDKGELLLRIGNDGITQNAVLKDLIFFGDIRAKRL